jgi:hypothetical protein
MNPPTLAERLGTTTHLSPLLHKARRLGLGPKELELSAIQRGDAIITTMESPHQSQA